MNPMLTRRHLAAGALALLSGCTLRGRATDDLLYADDFDRGLGQWVVEAEKPGRITATQGFLDVDVSAGATLWFRPPLEAPVSIEYDVVAVAAGGAHDAVSDVNCFWMATDPHQPDGSVLATRRSGAFAEYDSLRTYYAGIGGNRNTSSRFRRYVGAPGVRPLLPQHDLSAPADLLEPNHRFHIQLIAEGHRVALLRDGRTLFALEDPAPYTHGRFGFRTTLSHLRFSRFRVRRPGSANHIL